jgi:hypothetical protein
MSKAQHGLTGCAVVALDARGSTPNVSALINATSPKNDKTTEERFACSVELRRVVSCAHSLEHTNPALGRCLVGYNLRLDDPITSTGD